MRQLTVAAAVLLVAACGGEEPASAPVAPAPPRVVFYAEGNGTKSAGVTMKTESGGTIQKDVSLPMGNVETGEPGVPSEGFKSGDFLYLSLQNKEAAGSVTCRIKVGDKVIDEATSSGGYKIATCQGKMP